MKKTFCYLQTPRELIRAEKILLDADIDVVIRPAPEPIFGLCSMAIDVENTDLVFIVSLLEAAGLKLTINETGEDEDEE